MIRKNFPFHCTVELFRSFSDETSGKVRLFVTSSKYKPVDIAELKPGLLLERPLSVFLKNNGKYVVIARDLWPLEAQNIERIKKYGGCFSSEPSLAERYPEYPETVTKIQGFLQDENLSPFEKSFKIRNQLKWLEPLLFPQALTEDASPDLVPGMFLMVHALGVPRAETLEYLSEQSLDVYSYTLRMAATSGLFAMYLGYHDENFLKRFISTVFCSDAGILQENFSKDMVQAVTMGTEALSSQEGNLVKGRADKTIKLIKEGQIPGLAGIDHRMTCLIKANLGFEWECDELNSIVALAKWFCRLSSWGKTERFPLANPVLRKLISSLGLEFEAEGKRLSA